MALLERVRGVAADGDRMPESPSGPSDPSCETAPRPYWPAEELQRATALCPDDARRVRVVDAEDRAVKARQHREVVAQRRDLAGDRKDAVGQDERTLAGRQGLAQAPPAARPGRSDGMCEPGTPLAAAASRTLKCADSSR